MRISRLHCIGHVNRMDSKRKVSRVFNYNPQVSRLRGRPKTDGGTGYKQILIDTRVRSGKRRQETETTGRSALRRGRSALDCSAIEEEEEEEDLVLYSFYI